MHKTKHKERNLPVGFFSWITLQVGKSERKQKTKREKSVRKEKHETNNYKLPTKHE